MTPAPARWWCSPVSTRTAPPGSAPPAAGGDVMSVMVSLLTEEGKLGATRKLLARRRHRLPPERGKVPPRTRGRAAQQCRATGRWALRRAPPRLVNTPKGNHQLLRPGDTADISAAHRDISCLLYTSPSPRDGLLSRMPSS